MVDVALDSPSASTKGCRSQSNWIAGCSTPPHQAEALPDEAWNETWKKLAVEASISINRPPGHKNGDGSRCWTTASSSRPVAEKPHPFQNQRPAGRYTQRTAPESSIPLAAAGRFRQHRKCWNRALRGLLVRRHLLNSTALTTTTAGALTVMGLSAAMGQPASVARYNWTGCYIGLNAGGLSGHIDQSVTVPAPVNRVFSDSGRDGSFTGGGQAGCNWQAVPQYWVLGIEADINSAHVKRSQNFAFAFGGEDTVGSQETKLRWFGTVRGRLGATLNATLLYVTGGLAFGDVHSQVNAVTSDPGGVTGTYFGSYSQIRTGWVVGAGVEHKFSDRWSGKLEYLHFDLGSFQYNVNLVSGAPDLPATWQANAQMTGDIVRVGINYKFGP
jgi:outer membrane immunogenic protein